jgi:hypothetical protein
VERGANSEVPAKQGIEKIEIKIKVKGNGQECPFDTGLPDFTLPRGPFEHPKLPFDS